MGSKGSKGSLNWIRQWAVYGVAIMALWLLGGGAAMAVQTTPNPVAPGNVASYQGTVDSECEFGPGSQPTKLLGTITFISSTNITAGVFRTKYKYEYTVPPGTSDGPLTDSVTATGALCENEVSDGFTLSETFTINVKAATAACDWSVSPNPAETSKKPGETFEDTFTITATNCASTTFTLSKENPTATLGPLQPTASGYQFSYKLPIPADPTGTVTDKIKVTATCPIPPGSRGAVPQAACNESIPVPVTIRITPATTYTLTVKRDGTGTGQVKGGGNYAEGADVGVSATADLGSTFVKWTSSDPNTTCAASFKMPAKDLTCTATFTAVAPNTYTLTVKQDGTGTGQVKGGGNYAEGADVGVSATADPGSTFVKWTSSDPNTTCAASFKMPASNLTCTATFTAVAPTTYTVTTKAEPAQGGTFSPSSRTVNQGQTTTFTVTPNPGYTIKSVTGTTCGGSLSGTTYTTGPVTAACTVNATFTASVALQPAPAPSTAGLNETVPLMVTVLADNGQPVAGVAVTWNVSPANASGKLLNPQGGQPESKITVNSNTDGKAIAQFATGAEPLAYTISAAVGADKRDFGIVVGTMSGGVQTPAAQMARYLNKGCVENPGTRQSFTNLCNQVGSATPAQRAIVDNQLTPRNTSDATNANQAGARGQAGNVLSRLAALRHGASGISLSGLSLNQNGEQLSAEALAGALTGKGGAAGDDPGTNLGGRLGIFINGSINRGDKSQTTMESGFNYDAYNITGGMDYRFTDALVAGLALGYSSSNADLNDSGGSMDNTAYALSAYANYFINENVFLDGVLMYGKGSFDMKRNIDYVITGQQFTANGSPDSGQWGARVGGGYDFKLGEGMQATVGGHLNYLKAQLDSYNETGAEGIANGKRLNLNLHVDENTLESLTFGLSGELSRAFSMSWGVLTPRLRAEWIHEFKDGAIPITAWLLDDPTSPAFGGTNIFFSQSDTQDPNYFLLGLGASAVFPNGVQGFLFYQSTVGKENYSEDFITAGIRFEF